MGKLKTGEVDNSLELNEMINGIFNIYDKNNDIMIDFDEFCSYIQFESYEFQPNEVKEKLIGEWKNFDLFFENNDAKKYYREYLCSSFCEENLDFLIEVNGTFFLKKIYFPSFF